MLLFSEYIYMYMTQKNNMQYILSYDNSRRGSTRNILKKCKKNGDYSHIGYNVYCLEMSNSEIENYSRLQFKEIIPNKPETHTNGIDMLTKNGWKAVASLFFYIDGKKIVDVTGNEYDKDGAIIKEAKSL